MNVTMEAFSSPGTFTVAQPQVKITPRDSLENICVFVKKILKINDISTGFVEKYASLNSALKSED